MFAKTEALYADLAKTLGLTELTPDANGGVQLNVGDDGSVALFAEDEFTVLVVCPVTSLPKEMDYGTALFLLRRNFYDSPIAPFRVSCDTAGTVVIWGRVPVDGLTGEQLAGLVDGIAAEADLIRGEIEVDTTPFTEEATAA